jgi:peptidoglycan DL-endopeptidase CwlO
VAKHRLQRESSVSRTVRGAVIAGAVTAGTVGLPAVPAMAATVTIPGIGDFNVPDMPQLPVFAAPELPPLPQFQGLPGIPPLPQVAESTGERALDAARTKVGARYSWGGTGPNAFDCSGLVQWAYKQAGINLPRTSFEQGTVGQPVSISDLRPGDIVISNGGGHASIYAGDGQILEASTTGVPVQFSPLSSQSFYAARRI